MTMTLTLEQARAVEELLQQGEFENSNDVLNAALDLLVKQKEERRQRLEDLRAEIALGDAEIERGDAVEFDPEAILHRVHEALKQDAQVAAQ